MQTSLLKVPFLSAFIVAATLLIAPVHASAQSLFKWGGDWSMGVTLDSTDCDTDAVRLKDSLNGIVRIEKVTRTVKKVKTTTIQATFPNRAWKASKVTRKKFIARASGRGPSSIPSTLTETITISDVMNNEGYVMLVGRLAIAGTICNYEYSGSIAK